MALENDDLMSPPSGVTPLILNVTIVGRDSGKTDEIVRLLKKIQSKALSDQEPGTSVYRITRGAVDKNVVNVYEVYNDAAAMAFHTENADFKELVSRGEELASELQTKWFSDV
ncbi:Dimeric alpha-beta barrel [Ceraceosorus bombacis]|uniref:Dimeric alpha-beta barrel n=1 Tax=Ceraceosorus bombacis TaxID=401625 RepID=A0A0P1BQF3_9BASI|nr:Dimeric alpha-beta barrel [Ceraceosorus bombacis]